MGGKENYSYGEFAAGMCSAIIDILRGESRSRFGKPRLSGSRVATHMLPKFIQGLSLDILKRKKKSKHQGVAVSFVVDDSGSMCGSRSVAAWRGAAMLGIACERARFPFCLIRYGSNWSVIKVFTEPLSKFRDQLSYYGSGGTRVHAAMEGAFTHLIRRKEERKIMFVLTDGCTSDASGICREIEGAGVEVVPILLGNDAVHYKERWEGTNPIVIPDSESPVGPMLVARLAAQLGNK